MAIMTTERPPAAVVRALHDQLDPPEGYRVEIIEGKLEVAATPFGKHALVIEDLVRAILPTLPRSLALRERITLQEPEIDRYEPDLGIWPRAVLSSETEWVFPGEECLFAVEVTSPDQERRDYTKAAGYARADVPVYLIVDRKRRTCIVLTQPVGAKYTHRNETPFGKLLTLPLETPVTVDTSEF